jgi:hypothetical protein
LSDSPGSGGNVLTRLAAMASFDAMMHATMPYRLAAEAVLLLHLAFIVFAVLGAALTARWRWVVWVHVPAAAWGFFVELTGRVCPLTDAENALRIRAGQSGYSESFLEHYLLSCRPDPGRAVPARRRGRGGECGDLRLDFLSSS